MFNNIKAKALLVACLVFSSTALPNGNEKRHWVGSWASMPQEVEPANLAPAPFVCNILLVLKCYMVENTNNLT